MTRFMRSEPIRSLSIRCSTTCCTLQVPGTGKELSSCRLSPSIALAGAAAPATYRSIKARSIAYPLAELHESGQPAVVGPVLVGVAVPETAGLRSHADKHLDVEVRHRRLRAAGDVPPGPERAAAAAGQEHRVVVAAVAAVGHVGRVEK